MRRRSALFVALSVLVAGTFAALGLAIVPAVSQAAKPPPKFYLSLGDSYSVGYQPGMGATAGYTAYVAKKTKYQLENFGCGGATTTSILTAPGCIESGYGPVAATDVVPYHTITQEAAALAFIGDPAKRGKVGLITVSVGGNDVTACAKAKDPVGCVGPATTTIQTNVTQLVRDLNGALAANGDGSAKIIGLTYPDVILGDYVYPPGSPNTSLANLSVIAFHSLVNPALIASYTSVPAGSFVNVTEAPYKRATAGSETPLTTTTRLSPYGVIPDAVWEICKLTYYCTLGNIHADTMGYDFIGRLVYADFASL
jgi:lysophospholipase L1-like esterase